MFNKESAGISVDPQLFADKSILVASLNMLRLNWRTSGISFVCLLALVIVKEVMQKNDIGAGIPDAIAWSLFAGPIIRTLYLGEIGIDKVDSKPGMWLRVYALGILTYAPATAVSLYLDAAGTLKIMTIGGITLLLFLASFLGVLVAAFLGTWIVPIATRSKGSFGVAFQRGKATFFYSLPRLFAVPFILNVAFAVFTLAGAQLLPTGDILSEQNYVNMIELSFYSVGIVLQMFATATILVIIVRAYQRAVAPSAEMTP